MVRGQEPIEPHSGGMEALDEPELPTPRPRGAEEASLIAPDPEVGEVVAGFELLAHLGKGAAGTVFKARRQRDGAILAFKVLSASKVKRARVVQRFFDEVRAASSVRHPALVQVFDFIEEESPRRLAYAMEFVDGLPLRARLQGERALPLRMAIQVGVQVAEALTALHDVGIVHRDLKPENILVMADDGGPPRVKILDFGVVKFLPVDRTQAASASDEKPGTFVGTPRYMAPEQAAGAAVDTRADLFALGVLLFEMITGRCPHKGDSLKDVVLAKLEGAPRLTINPDRELLPAELTDVVDACLQLEPKRRPADARRVANALRDAEIVLFTVGSIRADERGTPVRRVDPAPEPTPLPERAQPRPPTRDTPIVAPTPPSAAAPPRARRWLRVAFWAAVMVALALGLAILARQLTPRDEVLLLPDPPAHVPAPAPAEDEQPEAESHEVPQPSPEG